MSARLLRIASVALATACVCPSAGEAQLISPGRLSTPHTELEGIRNCTSCHQLGRSGVAADRCLECHQSVASRISAERGYHATVSTDDCASCHQEHLGTDFDLIRLDEDSFDHSQVGYELQGSHAEARCRDCHRADHVRNPGVLTAEGERGALDRTFLGLTTECASCHQSDSPHGDQFAGQACADCHDTGRWDAMPDFDHSGTAFPLRGLHARVGCTDCHGSGEEATYRGVAHDTCNGCHTDPHSGSMEGTCSGCHDERGWHELRSGSVDSSFDHTRTSFVLRGAHAVADCSACHRTGTPPRGELVAISYRPGTSGRAYPLPVASSCSSCHVDRHAASASAGRWVECASCHGETRWTPSEFGLARHSETRFPLTGGHAATPCGACHVETVAGRDRVVLAPAAAGCIDCHAQDDPHEGRFAGFTCESCHTTLGFEDATFDHAAYTTPGQRCADCHEALDPHGGQFEGTDCAQCHRTDSFEVDSFDHSQTAFPLDGAHDGAECGVCHTTEDTGPSAFVRYRPLGTECTDCHGGDR